MFAMHEDFVKSGRCVVPGAGGGVPGTESVVLKLCEGRPPAARVRVDGLPAVGQNGPIGPTLAESILDAMVYGGRRFAGGKLKSVIACQWCGCSRLGRYRLVRSVRGHWNKIFAIIPLSSCFSR